MPIEWEQAEKMPEVRESLAAQLLNDKNEPSGLMNDILATSESGKPIRIKGIKVGTVRSTFKGHRGRSSTVKDYINKLKLEARISKPSKINGEDNEDGWVYILLVSTAKKRKPKAEPVEAPA